MQNETNAPKLMSLNKWLSDMGVSPTTGWRWRNKGILQTVNIYGRLYISEEVAAEFYRRAKAGEFAAKSNLGRRATERQRR